MPKVLLTGSQSMIGRQVQSVLEEKHYSVVAVSHRDYNLLENLWNHMVPEVNYIIHLATYSGNISFNQKYPFDTFWRTTQIGLNIFNYAATHTKKPKVISILSSCAIADKPGKEELGEIDLWDGLPNSTIECHGLAKRNLHALSRQYHKQFDATAVCCIVNNSFGPWDSFDEDKTKVIGGLINRFYDAKERNLPSVTCWGSGMPLREFIYCKDAARLIVSAMENYEDSLNPINLSSGFELTIRDLASCIATEIGYTGQIIWDTSKPDGQMRKKLDISKMNQLLPKIEFTPFEQAIKETIEWYKNEYRNNTSKS